MTLRSLSRSALLLTVAGCSSGGAPNTKCLPISTTVGPAGAEISVTASCDALIAGTSLLIPQGALASPITITLHRGTDLAMSPQVAVGPSLRFTPDGLAFAKPATLTLPYRPSDVPMGYGAAIAVSSVLGRSTLQGSEITIDSSNGTIAVEIAHFTDYQAIAAPGGPMNDGGVDGGDHDGGPTDGGNDGPRDGGNDGPRDGGFDGGNPDLPPPIDGGGIPDGAMPDLNGGGGG